MLLSEAEEAALLGAKSKTPARLRLAQKSSNFVKAAGLVKYAFAGLEAFGATVAL